MRVTFSAELSATRAQPGSCSRKQISDHLSVCTGVDSIWAQRVPKLHHYMVEESPSLEAYPDPPSGSRLSSTLIMDSPAQIKQDECDRWFPLVLEEGGDDEEEEIGVLARRALHHSPISVASSPAPPEPMSGTRDEPTLVEESPAPTTSWWRTVWPPSILWWRKLRCL